MPLDRVPTDTAEHPVGPIAQAVAQALQRSPGAATWRWLALQCPAASEQAQVARALRQALHELWPAHALCAGSPVPEPGPMDEAALLRAPARTGEWLRVSLSDDGRTLRLAADPCRADAGTLLALAAELGARMAHQPVAAACQYPDYLAWRDALVQGEDAAAGQAHWQQALVGTEVWPAARSPVLRASAGRAQVTLDAALVARITSAAQAAHATPRDWLQAAWWWWLARLDRFQPALGHELRDARIDYAPMQGALGLFSQPLPLRLDAGADEAFGDWLARWQAQVQGHAGAQEFWPVARPPVQAHLATGFAWHEAPALPAGWQVADLQAAWPGTGLLLGCVWSDTQARLTIEGQGFAQAEAERLLDQLLALLPRLLDQPMLCPSEVPSPDADLHAALTGAEVPAATTGVDALWRHWVQATPQAPALRHAGQTWSYRELGARVDAAAAAMQVAFAQAPDRPRLVAVQLPRSAALVVALLACWQAGAAYLPLDPEAPAARRDAVLAEARPVLLVSEQANAAPCPVLSEAQLQRGESPPVTGQPCDPQSLAYVLYTSGSTGRPKGVMVSHGALRHYVQGVAQALGLAAPLRWALTGSVAADLGNTALFGALCHGGCLVVASAEDMQDAAHFGRFLAREQVQALKIVPSHLAALIDDAVPDVAPQWVVLGGEAAPAALLQRLQAHWPGVRIANHYGPTETTVGVMVHVLQAGAVPSDPLPLDRTLPGSRVCLLDATGRPVAAGEVGELCIGGAQLCEGYLNRPELNAVGQPGSPFIADPQRPGQRLYRSGDLACLRAEGGLQLLGRADDQLKVRGFRVEPAETQAWLAAQAGVREAFAMGLPDASGHPALAAFVVTEPGLAVDALRARLAAELPVPQVPLACVPLPALPRLGNGKVDRQALAECWRQALAQALTEPARPPADALEALLARGMGELLGRGALTVTQDFFDQGGHSLLVIRLVARLRKQLAVDLPPASIFDHPSPEALAATLRARDDGAALLARAQALQTAEP